MSVSPELSIEDYFDSPAIAEAAYDELEIDEAKLLEDIEQVSEESSFSTLKNTKAIRNEESLTGADLSALPPCEQNQEALFRELMKDHQKRLYRFVIRYIDHPDDAADITQQAFVEAARTIVSFRGDSKLSTWLYGIAMNMVRNYLSRAPHRVYRFESDEILGGLPCPEPDPSDSLAQRELLGMVQCAFDGLPTEMSEVLSLVAIDEISYQDAADILAIPLGTVRSRVSRARAVLRTHFQDAGIALKF